MTALVRATADLLLRPRPFAADALRAAQEPLRAALLAFETGVALTVSHDWQQLELDDLLQVLLAGKYEPRVITLCLSVELFAGKLGVCKLGVCKTIWCVFLFLSVIAAADFEAPCPLPGCRSLGGVVEKCELQAAHMLGADEVNPNYEEAVQLLGDVAFGVLAAAQRFRSSMATLEETFSAS
jgi:hypothetical protein